MYDVSASGGLADTSSDVRLPLAGFDGASFVLSGTWVGTVIAEVSCNGYDASPNWNHSCIWRVLGTSGGAGNSSTSTAGNGQYMVQELGGASHVRVRVFAYTSGTVQVALRTTEGGVTPPSYLQGVGNTSWFGSHRLAVVGGADQGNAARELHLSNTGPTVSDYGVVSREAPGNYGHVAANATTTHKSGAGVLRRITINDPGSAWVVNVYDNTAGSGTLIATIKPSASLYGPFEYHARFSTGLTTVTSGTTAGSLTVVWD
jgi:hypothetical protein